jgi:carboxylate-amine ligase
LRFRRQNVTFRMYSRRLIDENRWRAARYGLDGKLIDFGRKCEMDERDLLHEMLEFIAPEIDELGSHAEMAHIERIIREGTGADRQLAVWERTQDIKAVVDQIVSETSRRTGSRHTGGAARLNPCGREAKSSGNNSLRSADHP